jgi:CheY-like chemotaxis protein
MSETKDFLVVDDDEIFLFTATYVLKRSFPGYNMVTSRNGEDALARLQELKPRALFVDLNMPIMDGWELLDRIGLQADLPSYPVVIVTSSIDPSDKKRAANHPLKPQFVEKPLSEEKIQNLNLKIIA